MKRVAVAVLLLAVVGAFVWLATRKPTEVVRVVCNTLAKPEIPEWAHVAPDQIAEAKKYGVPVAFENDLGMRFVLIPAGTFMMGSPQDEEGRKDNEAQHEVTISRPFYMQVTETTNGQYSAWKPGYGAWLDSERLRSYLGLPYTVGDAHKPTVMQRYTQVEAFAAWLTGRDEHRTYRLPSEEEWEYACRAGTTTAFNVGDTLPYTLANDGTQPLEREEDDGPALVGSYPPNGWGLYDMHGNVSEWCAGRRDIGVPEVTGSLWTRNTRGGSHDDWPRDLRSAHRGDWMPDVGSPYIGFRVVSPLPERKGGK